MEFYRIQHAYTGIGKKFPQVETGIGKFHVQSPEYIGNTDFLLHEIEITPSLPELVLWNSAKVTDLISSSFFGTGFGLIISGKLKTIVEKYNPVLIQFFPIQVHHKNDIFQYWYMHPKGVNNDLIDFPNSDVWELKSMVKEQKRYFLSAHEFYQEACQKKYPHSLKIYSFKLLLNTPDFFMLNYIEGGVGYFVSQNLKDEIEQKKCSGIEFI